MADDSFDRLLLDLALQLSATPDLDTLLREVVRRLPRLLGAERGLAAIVDVRRQVTHAAFSAGEWEGPGHALPMSRSVLQRTLAGEPLITTDAAGDEALSLQESISSMDLGLMVSQPVFGSSGVVGLLYADAPRDGDANRGLGAVAEHMERLEAIAGIMGMAVDNVRLREAERFRVHALAYIVHELVGPITSILAIADSMDPSILREDELGRWLAPTARWMGHLVHETLQLTGLEGSRAPRAPVSVPVAPMARRFVSALGALLDQRRLQAVVVEDGEPVAAVTHEAALGIVLTNLLHNAHKHGRAGTVIEVRISRRGDAGPDDSSAHAGQVALRLGGAPALRPRPGAPFVQVSVTNAGPTISAEARARIFEPWKGPGDSGARGTGLGLSIVAQYVAHLGGRVWVDPAYGDGVRVSFTVPTALTIEDA